MTYLILDVSRERDVAGENVSRAAFYINQNDTDNQRLGLLLAPELTSHQMFREDKYINKYRNKRTG